MAILKILAGPGAGKTRTLIGLADAAVQGGRMAEEVGFVSFSRAAVDEARDRATLALDLPAKRFAWWRTLHSTAYRLLGVRRSQLVTEERLGEFTRSYGYHFTAQDEPDPDDVALLARPNERDGDQLVAWYDWYRHTLQPDVETGIARSSRHGAEALASSATVKRFITRYEAWKYEGNLVDFTDLLTRCLRLRLRPPVSVLFCDEQQDNTPLQAALIDSWAAEVSELVLCGDPNQAIYGWAGADGAWLRGRPADAVDILPQSHRIPEAIKTVAQRVIRRARVSSPLSWLPRPGEGMVEHDADLSRLDVDNGERWIIMARNRTYLFAIARYLTERGTPYSNRSGRAFNSNPTELAGVVAGLELAAGRYVTVGAARRMLRYVVPQVVAAGGLWVSGALTALDDLADRYADEAHVGLDQLPGVTDLFRAMLRDEVGRWEVFGRIGSRTTLDAMRAIYARHGLAGLTERPKVEIGTIHSMKGREADHAVIVPDMTASTFRGVDTDPDGEARTWYVAVTRASRYLHLLAPRSGRAFAF